MVISLFNKFIHRRINLFHFPTNQCNTAGKKVFFSVTILLPLILLTVSKALCFLCSRTPEHIYKKIKHRIFP